MSRGAGVDGMRRGRGMERWRRHDLKSESQRTQREHRVLREGKRELEAKETAMTTYTVPDIKAPAAVAKGEVLMIASGDLRQSANQVCWPAQVEVERVVTRAFAAEGWTVRRAHPYREDLKHGFIYNQRMGMDVFEGIDPQAPIVVVEAVWQYTHHILSGLVNHRGPILTVANLSGQWPGLVGMLNLNGSMLKAGVKFSTIWSKDFDDPFFVNGLKQWIREGRIDHDRSHVHTLGPLDIAKLPDAERKLGVGLARALKSRKAILGVFDEGCMGMYNAIIDDALLNATGVFKERLSQSARFERGWTRVGSRLRRGQRKRRI